MIFRTKNHTRFPSRPPPGTSCGAVARALFRTSGFSPWDFSPWDWWTQLNGYSFRFPLGWLYTYFINKIWYWVLATQICFLIVDAFFGGKMNPCWLTFFFKGVVQSPTSIHLPWIVFSSFMYRYTFHRYGVHLSNDFFLRILMMFFEVSTLKVVWILVSMLRMKPYKARFLPFTM